MAWDDVLSGLFKQPAAGQSDPLGTLVKVLGLANGYQSANNAIRTNNVATQGENQAKAIYAAIANPNSPMMVNATATQRAQNLSDFQQQLTEMQLADRRNMAMGRAPTFFAPERADETMSYLTSRGLPQLNAQAQAQAIARLTAAAGGLGGFAPAQAGRQSLTMQQGISNAATNTGLPLQILSAIRGNDPTKVQNPMMGQYGFNASNMPGVYGTPMMNGSYPQYNQMRYQ